jgi:hypothetical protein
MKYVGLLMHYIEQEYDNIPDYVSEEMDDLFRECWESQENIPNAAGLFYEKFLKVNT